MNPHCRVFLNSKKSHFMKIFTKFILLILSIFLSFSAFAQTPEGTDAVETCKAQSSSIDIKSLYVVGSHLESSLGPITTLSVLAGEALPISNKVISLAFVLAGIFVLIAVLATVVKSMISNKPIGDAVLDHILTASIVAGLLGSYAWFIQTAMSIAGTLNNMVSGSSPMNAIWFFAKRIFAALANAFTAVGNVISCAGWMDAITLMLPLIMILLLLVFSAVFMIISLVDMIFILLLGPITMAVGIAVGPLFVACYSTPFTRPWFDKWLGFITGGMLIQFVAYVLLEILGQAMSTIGSKFTSDTSELLGVALALAMISYVLGAIFKQVPSMVNALIPGSTGVSNAGNVGDKLSSMVTGGLGGLVTSGIGGVGGAIASTVASRAASGVAAGAASAGAGAVASAVAKKIL